VKIDWLLKFGKGHAHTHTHTQTHRCSFM